MAGDPRCRAPECDRTVAIKSYSLCHFHNTLRKRGEPFRKPARRDGGAALVRDDRGRKECIGCDEWQPESSFASMKGRPDGLQTLCRGCKSRNYYANAEKVRDEMRRARYGLSRQDFDEMLSRQGGECAICGTGDPGSYYWSVDHDHDCCPYDRKSSVVSCGACVRGILCTSCNHMLGRARDEARILLAGATYLDAWSRAGHVARVTSTRGVA